MSDALPELFHGLLDVAERPDHSEVDVQPTRVVVRLRTPSSPVFPAARLGLVIGLMFAGLGLGFWLATPISGDLFWLGVLFLLLLPPLGGVVGLYAQLELAEQRRRTLRMLELHAHRAVLRGQDRSEVTTWSLHDLEELWVSRDRFGPIVGSNHGSTVEAVRVGDGPTARWLVALMRVWRTERVQEPDAEGLDAIASLAARADREVAR